MKTRKFLAAVRTYRSRGGQFTCSPNQSCEGKNPNDVILKDFDGNVVAEVILSPDQMRALDQAQEREQEGYSSDWSLAGMSCYLVGSLSLIGGLLGASQSLVYLGFAASTAPIFAIGSIANNTKRSALILQQMAELNAAVGKPQGPSQANDGEE